MARIALLCPRCGSSDVVADASATWNIETGSWELCGCYDNKSCQACEHEFDDAETINLDKFPEEGCDAWLDLARAAAAKAPEERTLAQKYLVWKAAEESYNLENADA